jgi:hypothetical protein
MLPRFWRKIKYRYDLVGSYCENCGRSFYPPRNVCPNCRRKSNIREIRFGDCGKVISYSVVHDSENTRMRKPYIVAMIKLDDGPVITSQLVCSPDEVQTGMRVRKVFRKYGEEGESGIIYYGTKFVPADSE